MQGAYCQLSCGRCACLNTTTASTPAASAAVMTALAATTAPTTEALPAALAAAPAPAAEAASAAPAGPAAAPVAEGLGQLDSLLAAAAAAAASAASVPAAESLPAGSGSGAPGGACRTDIRGFLSSSSDLSLMSSLLSLAGYNYSATASNLTRSAAGSAGAAGAAGTAGTAGATDTPRFSVFVPTNDAVRAWLAAEGLTQAQLLESREVLKSVAAYHATLLPLAYADMGALRLRRAFAAWTARGRAGAACEVPTPAAAAIP